MKLKEFIALRNPESPLIDCVTNNKNPGPQS
jgi:hypothetical protein